MNELEIYTDEELMHQSKKQAEFLVELFPFLKEDVYSEYCVELRPIRRTQETKYVHSINLWTLDEVGINKLFEFNKKLNGKTTCVYYSCFTLDSKTLINGKSCKGRINNNNAKFTTILPIDFDSLSYEEFEIEKQKLTDIGIETIDIFTGNGVQSIVLLDKEVYDTRILKKWTNLLSRKGFKVDESLVDAARLLRHIYTYNCKEFDKTHNKYNPINPKGLYTYELNWTNKRYDVVDVFEKIQIMPDLTSIPVLKEDVDEINNIASVEQKEFKKIDLTKKKEKKKKEVLEVIKSDIEVVKERYGQVIENISIVPDCVINMLYKTPKGVRNDVLLFLVPYFKNALVLNANEIKEALILWGYSCEPSLEESFVINEVERLLEYNQDYRFGKYTEAMKSVFGTLEIQEYVKDNNVKIMNDIFEDFNIISETAFRIYLILELDKSLVGQRNYTIEDISKIAKLSRKTVDRNISYLIKFGYIIKNKRVSKMDSEKYIYYLNPYRSNRFGFTLIPKATIKLMLVDLTNTEIKLYSYLYRMLNKQRKVVASQRYIGLKIGKSQNRVSELTSNLNQKQYLNKTTLKIGELLHCRYIIEF